MKILVICALLVSSYGYSVNNNLGIRHARSADKLEDLKIKLAKLQGLLKEIRQDESEEAGGLDDLNASDRDDKDLAAVDQSKEPMTTENQLDTGDAANMKIKKFVEGMTPRDVRTLRELKQMLALAKEKRIKPETRGQDAGTFADDSVGTVSEGADKYDWRDLARGLQSEKEAFYLQKKMNEEPFREDPKSVKSQEGTFGAFRDEIKESVEKNLLSDIALAIHSGISLDEIIADLTEPETPRGDSGWWKRD